MDYLLLFIYLLIYLFIYLCTKVLVSSAWLRNLWIRLMLCRWKKVELQSLLIWVDILSWEWNQGPRFQTTGFVFTTNSRTVMIRILMSICLIDWWCPTLRAYKTCLRSRTQNNNFSFFFFFFFIFLIYKNFAHSKTK